ncbi:MAG: hypothetical protein GX825_00120 [Syntrophomonadaceae bacterium]|nr:hypothetical protein [Syntrophomonadaceae bacterium]
MKESTKPLTIRLPKDHLAFQVEAGKRSEVVREWLEIGYQLSEMRKQLERLADMASTQPLGVPSQDQPVKIDEKEFLKYFE